MNKQNRELRIELRYSITQQQIALPTADCSLWRSLDELSKTEYAYVSNT